MSGEDVSNPIQALELEDGSAQKHTTTAISSTDVPNMWSRDYLGLYAQYAAVGLLYGSTAFTANTFCPYVFHGEPNVCAIAANIACSNLPWKQNYKNHLYLLHTPGVRVLSETARYPKAPL